MKWSNKKTEPFSSSYSRTARKNGWKTVSYYNEYGNNYYFICEKGDEAFNSLWENLSYQKEEDCLKACEKWIDERKGEQE